MKQQDLIYAEAIARAAELIGRAQQLPLKDPTAMQLATADSRGRPSVRTVLLRGWDARGFVFFSNSESRKGRELAENPYAALCMYWEPFAEQLRVEGSVQPVSSEESDAYWRGRPRESQLGAWASRQSRLLEHRETLAVLVREREQQFAGKDVPRPDYWFGYRVVPARIEFWIGQAARLHERTLFEETADGWVRSYLYP